jgi:2-methylcitrate dehydratase PrpD
MVAVGLLKGGLTAADYEDDAAADSWLDRLRARMQVKEDQRMSAEYLDPSKRSIGNAVQVVFRDGTATPKVTVDYPVGHRRRRAEGIPLLLAKAKDNLCSRLPAATADHILQLCANQQRLEQMPVHEFVALLVI